MTVEEQIKLWVNGDSKHNLERDECCPDFSCCEPGLLWSKEDRVMFAEADKDLREQMLMGSLVSLAVKIGDDLDLKVRVAGTGEPD